MSNRLHEREIAMVEVWKNDERCCQPKGANFQAPRKDEFLTDDVLQSTMTVINNNVICVLKLLRLNLKCSCSKNIL